MFTDYLLFQMTYNHKKSVTVSFQLTETSARYARKISGTTALQEALKEKQQHIEQLLLERDLERCEVAKATSHAGEVQQEMVQLRKGRDQVRYMHTWYGICSQTTTHAKQA